MEEVVYIETKALPTPVVKPDRDSVLLLFPKRRLDYGTFSCGMRHYYYAFSPFKVRGALRIHQDYYEQKILPALSGLPSKVAEITEEHAEKILRDYFKYLRAYKFSENEYKITYSKPATHFVAHLHHDVHSRAHGATLEVVGADVIAEYSTSCAIDSLVSKIIKAPLDTDVYYIINEGPYRGQDSYIVKKIRFNTSDKFGIVHETIAIDIPSLEEAEDVISTILEPNSDDIEEVKT